MTRLCRLGLLVIVGILILIMAIVTVGVVLVTYCMVWLECAVRYINYTLWRIVHHNAKRV
jgi:hypothetical protein